MNRHNISDSVVEYILTRDIRDFESLTVDCIAQEFNISRAYLSYKFKLDKKVPLSEYILTIKIIRSSLVMMGDKKIKIEDLAKTMGFSRADYFINIFKEVVGTTPGKYQKILRLLKSQKKLEPE